MKEDIYYLIKKYEKLIDENRQKYIPVELTTKEVGRLEGRDNMLLKVVGDLKEIMRKYPIVDETFLYTE